MKPRDVLIKAVLNGWIVEVGCQTLVFTDEAVMFAELSRYLDNPAKIENIYLRDSVNAKFFQRGDPIAGVPEDHRHAQSGRAPFATRIESIRGERCAVDFVPSDGIAKS